MCSLFLIVVFVAFAAYNFLISYEVCRTFLLSEPDDNADEEAVSSDSLLVIQYVGQLVNAIYGLTLVCFKVKMKIVVLGWILVAFIAIMMSSSFDIWFVLKNTYQIDAYALNTCVSIKVFGSCSLYVVVNYFRERVVASKIDATV